MRRQPGGRRKRSRSRRVRDLGIVHGEREIIPASPSSIRTNVVAGASARDYRVFAGVIDLDHWPAWGRLLFKALGGRAGDNRQWPDIDSWAEEIADGLGAQD